MGTGGPGILSEAGGGMGGWRRMQRYRRGWGWGRYGIRIGWENISTQK